MPREPVLHIVLRRRTAFGLAAAAAALVLFLRAEPLSTEQLTMTSYYPSPYGVYQQMRVTGDAFLAYDPANPTARVGVGSVSPPNTFATRMDVAAGNLHVQGSENASRLRVGDAWGVNGVYSEAGDLVLGAQSGWVRVGPNGGGQRLRAENALMVRTVEISNTSCASMAYGNGVQSCAAGQYATYIEGVKSPLMRQSVPLIGGSSMLNVQTEIGMVQYNAYQGYMLCCNP